MIQVQRFYISDQLEVADEEINSKIRELQKNGNKIFEMTTSDSTPKICCIVYDNGETPKVEIGINTKQLMAHDGHTNSSIGCIPSCLQPQSTQNEKETEVKEKYFSYDTHLLLKRIKACLDNYGTGYYEPNTIVEQIKFIVESYGYLVNEPSQPTKTIPEMTDDELLYWLRKGIMPNWGIPK